MFLHGHGGKCDTLVSVIHEAHCCSQGRDVDLLFGLDMLKAHQACIDLEKNCLRINGREVTFLSEHELPDKAKTFELPPEDPQAPPSTSQPTRSGAGTNFPGAGNTIGAPPATSNLATPARSTPASRPALNTSQSGSGHPEESIRTLVGLGASREQAIACLNAAGGNLDAAASLLF